MNAIRDQIREALCIRGDIYAPFRGSEPDKGYPDTHLDMTCIKAVFDTVRPTFWLEFGSMVGGSATRVCRFIKGSGSDCQIVCVDPFCGSVDMWMWENLHRRLGRWLYLNLDGGFPTIRQRFMANVCSEGCDDVILPIQATTMVGAGVVKTLFGSRLISSLPQAVYLDSAHIEKETYMELEATWDIVAPGGVLFGDDWNWDAVRNDVSKFSKSVLINDETRRRFMAGLPGCQTEGNVTLAGIHWFLFK